MRHRRSPGVEHRGDADVGAEMLRVSRDRHHRLRRRTEQQIVDYRLVLHGDVGELGGKREDNMEVANGQQVGFALGEPGACCRALAFGAVPVAAAVVGNTPVPAVLTGINVAAKRRCATGLDRRHDLELMKAQVPGMGGPVGGADGTEDIGDLDRGAQAASGAGILVLHQQRQTL